MTNDAFECGGNTRHGQGGDTNLLIVESFIFRSQQMILMHNIYPLHENKTIQQKTYTIIGSSLMSRV